MTRRRCTPTFVVAIAALAACNGAPTAPMPSPPDRRSPPPLLVRCHENASLQCTASVHPLGDVTAAAVWSAAESFGPAMDVPIPASTVVTFPAPGIVSVLRPVSVYIRADYDQPGWGWKRSIAPHAYALDPAAPPVPLAYLRGDVNVGGATVEIIEGAGRGKRAVTLEGASYAIEFMLLAAPFTARASKSGYTSDVKTHPGIVDDAYGYPSNSHLHFNMTPLQ